MALMDLIGLGADKQAVVFDIGYAFTKIGFAGEHSPRHILRSEVPSLEKGLLTSKNLLDIESRSKKENESLFKDFFHSVYFKYLLVNPKERKVVISEGILTSIQLRNIIANVLFNYFEVVSVIFIPSQLLAIFALGLKTGLIVDCGYKETSVIPIYQQIPLLNAMNYISLGAKTVHEYIEKDIKENAIIQVNGDEKSAKSVLKELDEKVLEDIKVRCCFIGLRDCDYVAKTVKYPINSNMMLHISGKLRAHAMDSLFDINDEEKSIATIILDSLLQSPIDCRKELAERIVLVGGSVISKGFESRLNSELKYLLTNSEYKNKLFIKKIMFCKPNVPANYCSWLGASMFGTLEVLSDYSISKERFKVDSKIPDWSSILTHVQDDGTKSSDDKFKWTSMRRSLSLSSSQGSTTPQAASSVTERLRKELGLTSATKK